RHRQDTRRLELGQQPRLRQHGVAQHLQPGLGEPLDIMRTTLAQIAFGILLGTFLLVALAATIVNYSDFPAIRLGGTTNQVSDNGTALTRNGIPIGGGGDSLWATNATQLYPTNAPGTGLVRLDQYGNLAIGTDGAIANNWGTPAFGDAL